MRKPVDEQEAAQFFDAWKVVFKAAMLERVGVSLEDIVDQAAAAHVVVRNAAMVADAALEKLVEKLDELKVTK